jgi:uncharacterized membrane protein
MEQDCRTLSEKVSDEVAKFGGSWSFIISGFALIILWVSINLCPYFYHYDDYPFILLNLFLSLIAAFQAPFILMSQRRVEVKQDAIYRTLFREIKELVEIDLSLEHEVLETNKKLEQEIQELREIIKQSKSENKNDTFLNNTS